MAERGLILAAPTSGAGKTTVTLGNIIDKFLDQHGFTYTSSTKQSNFSSFGIGFDKVNYLNPGKQNLCRGR